MAKQRLQRATRKYLEWCLDPSPNKIPKQAFAHSVGYSMATLRRIDRDPEFIAEYQRVAIRMQVAPPEKVVELLNVLMGLALGGDLRAIETMLRWIGRVPAYSGRDLHEIATEVPKLDDLRQMTDNELADYLERLQERT